MRRALTLLAAAAALLATGATLSNAGTAPPVTATDPAAPPAPAPAPATPTTVSLSLSKATAAYGQQLTAHGTVEPATAGERVALEVEDGVSWTQVATTVTDVTGAFHVELKAKRGGAVRARDAANGALSAPVRLQVKPVVRLRTRPGKAFGKATLSVRVAPASYAGRLSIAVKQKGKTVGHASGRARHGRLKVSVPTPGVGTFWLAVTAPSSDGLAKTATAAKVSARARTLSVGASGPDVRALVRRLAALRFHVPAAAWTYSSELYDSVIAFQKTYGLPRTGVVDGRTWHKLGTATVIEPRYRGPSPHIEVDKTRQILIVVKGGAVDAILPTSTGATGNTPEGHHRILWKAPSTTTWLGAGILYRTLTFVGNSFAIHGWYSVPPYPASHGCVRIPIWTADWLYDQSPVGETVDVYR